MDLSSGARRWLHVHARFEWYEPSQAFTDLSNAPCVRVSGSVAINQNETRRFKKAEAVPCPFFTANRRMADQFSGGDASGDQRNCQH